MAINLREFLIKYRCLLFLGLGLIVLAVGSYIYIDYKEKAYEKEIKTKVNAALEQGRDEGYEKGYEIGFDEGYQQGYDVGSDEGYDDGRNEGYDAGRYDGYNEGYSDGNGYY